MEKLEIDNFKAYNAPITLELDNNNALLYGENGSGKTSIFEAIKLFYFKDRIISEQVAPYIVGQDRIDAIQQVLEKYRNDLSKTLTLKIDGENFNDHNIEQDNIFLISYNDLNRLDELSIKELINESYFSGKNNTTDWYSQGLLDNIVSSVNTALNDDFWLDNISIDRLDEDGKCSIKNQDNPIPKSTSLSKYFNESILHVIRFIILIECAACFRDDNKKQLLVFDDCFSSLDTPNRAFIIRYVLKKTEGIQKIVLTHNIGFYNLFRHIVNSNENQGRDWEKLQLYKLKDNHILSHEKEKKVKIIEDELNQGKPINEIGNELRQLFEVLLRKLSKYNNIGLLCKTNTLLDGFKSERNVFISERNNQLLDVYDLVKEIYNIVNNGDVPENLLPEKIKNKIEEFNNHAMLLKIKPILEDTRLIQKVALHQASHGNEGLDPISIREIKVALVLLKKLEEVVNNIEEYSERIDTAN